MPMRRVHPGPGPIWIDGSAAAFSDPSATRTLCTAVERAPLDRDLVVDLTHIRGFGGSPDDALRSFADRLGWRAHWTRVGCVVDDAELLDRLREMHLDHWVRFGRTRDEVERGLGAGPAPCIGPPVLITGPAAARPPRGGRAAAPSRPARRVA